MDTSRAAPEERRQQFGARRARTGSDETVTGHHGVGPIRVPIEFHRRPKDGRGLTQYYDDLRYTWKPYSGTQARLRGRLVYEPRIDLGAYAAGAVIDVIALEIRTARRTQTGHLSRWLAEALPRRPDVTDLAGCRFQTITEFRATIQSPEPASLRAALASVERQVPLDGPPIIRLIEVALDWYPTAASEQARLHMVAVLQRHFCPRPEFLRSFRDEPRFVSREDSRATPLVRGYRAAHGPNIPRGLVPLLRDPRRPARSEKPYLDPFGFNAPLMDSTLYYGDRDGDVMWRIQNKLTDERDMAAGCWRDLPPEERRARLEVTLKGEELRRAGLVTVDDLVGFRFQGLRDRYFECWLPTVGGRYWDYIPDRAFFVTAGVFGLELRQLAKARARRERVVKRAQENGTRPPPEKRLRGENGFRLAFKALNDRHSKALKQLSESWLKG